MTWYSRNSLRFLILLVITVIGLILCALMSLPFVAPLVFSMTLATLFLPYYRRLESKFKYPALLSLGFVCLIAVIVVVPLILIGNQFVTEAAANIKTVRTLTYSEQWDQFLVKHPQLTPYVTRLTG